eukprot:scpid102252/ scgid1828/ Multiple epidermal growth factor-like domains protein 10
MSRGQRPIFLLLPLTALYVASWLHGSSARICTLQKRRSVQSCYPVKQTYSEKFLVDCGVFGWASCTRYRTKYRTATHCTHVWQYYTEYQCCAGYQGSACAPVCSQTCHNRGRCSSPNTCTCAAGWTGTTCQTLCPTRTFGVGCKPCPCLNGGSCNRFSLSPTCTCTPGWRGSTCGWRCDAAHYGQNCASPCQCRNGATCNHINGQCT